MTAGGLVERDRVRTAPAPSLPARTPARPAVPAARAASVAPGALAGVTCLALVLWLAFDSGGWFPPTYQAAGSMAFALLAVLVAVPAPRVRPSTHALTAFGALAALALWTGLSATWSPAPAEALHDLQRALLYTALFGLAVLAAGNGRLARHLPWGVLAVLATVCVAGLLGHDGGRLEEPLGYWNAMGGMGAAAAVLGTGLAADRRHHPALRAAATAAAGAGGWALWLSLSRGSIVAAAVGAAVLLAAVPHRGAVLTALALAGAAAATGVLTDTPAGLAAAAAAQAAIATGGRQERLVAALAPARRAVLGLAALLALGGLLLAAVSPRADEATADASRWLDRQWAAFLQPTTAPGPDGAARLTTAKGTRSDLYRVAVDGFEAHPLRGDGAGGFEVRWHRERRVDETVRDAHSLPLQTLGELGLVGAALLLTFLVSLVLAIVRAARRRVALGRGQAAAVGATLAVWLVHSSVDWDWELPAFTGAVLVLCAAALPVGRPRRPA